MSAASTEGYSGVLKILTTTEGETMKTPSKQTATPIPTDPADEPLTAEKVEALFDELSMKMRAAAREVAPARPPSLFGVTVTGSWPEAH